ncbi:unnamed protein product [Bursaphelenchus okinawaensis]|uniref:Nuclear receptor domain-containing protein n=1 Tax=Bursaphelenchus okinawaensis TaxID=465554 RepID=A0A811KUJ6_9BILA|nr:unnamed protein product [Bursaphelenchus okinawaensis]CAG9110903.1 unnamed protein product [Bursaphelenchus okinawaensis]
MSRACEVCKAPSTEKHFGVRTCRPCAAFFRRSCIQERKYTCNLNGNCNVNQSVRILCPACRFQRCKDVGMLQDKIRTNFDKTGPKKRLLKQEYQEPSTSTEPTLLEKWTKSYQRFLEDTKNWYYSVHPDEIFNNNVSFSKGTLLEFCNVERCHQVYVFRMLEGQFDELPCLGKQDRIKIFNDVLSQFTSLSEFYLNRLYFPNDRRKLFLHWGSYLDLDDLEFFYSKEYIATTAQGINFRLLKTYRTKLFKLANKMRDIAIDEVEIAALTGLVFYREVHCHLECQDAVADPTEALIINLTDYCNTKMCRQKALIRVGMLLNYLRDLHESVLILREAEVIVMMTNNFIRSTTAQPTIQENIEVKVETSEFTEL